MLDRQNRTADFLSREIIDVMYGVYTGTNVDIYSILWNNFRQHSLPQYDKEGNEVERTEIKMARFWALVVDARYKELGIDILRVEKNLWYILGSSNQSSSSQRNKKGSEVQFRCRPT